MNIQNLQDIANILRRDSIESTTSAGSGHPTSCLSCAEIMSALFFEAMSFNPQNPKEHNNDEFILSKGHAAPILYATLFRAGCIKSNLKNLRKLNSPLEGHPIPNSLKWIKVATGSLGQGLSVGIGFALAAKLQNLKFKTYVLLGDSEIAEGSIYEALQLAPKLKLNNLIAIVDVNRLGQTGETMEGHDIKTYKSRFQSFGWNTLTINGHDIKQILKALNKAKKSKKPTAILAKTFKGQGVSFLKNKNGWHGKPLSDKQMEKAFKEIPNPVMPKIKSRIPKKSKIKNLKVKKPKLKTYKIGQEVATREAYGETLAMLAKANKSVIAIDAETGNSTHTINVKFSSPKQFIQTYIAEQNMISIALGLSKKGFNVFASTFSAFLTRAHDQIRMAAISKGDFTICGSHSGVSIGADGVSQMGLEELPMFLSLPNSTVFYPSDAVSTAKITEFSSSINGIKYIQTTRPKTPVIYNNKETFKVGDFKILRQLKKDKAVLIGAGITLHESLKAHEQLNKMKIPTAVIDLYCIKPLNEKKLIAFIKKHGNKVVITEDHYAEGGIGETLAEFLVNQNIKMKHLAVRELPHSGKKDELLKKYGIDVESIVNAMKSFK